MKKTQMVKSSRRQFLRILVFVVVLFASRDAFSWGVITHMTILDDILKDPRLDGEIKRILRENIAYAKGGVTGPDMFYVYVTSRYGDMAHYCTPGDLARRMLALAREETDVRERERKLAYAYGWMVHVQSDAVGHAWVNAMVGGEYDPENKPIVKAHKALEAAVDRKNLMDHADGMVYGDHGECFYSYDVDISVPQRMAETAFADTYDYCNALSSVEGSMSEALFQSYLILKTEGGLNDDDIYKRHKGVSLNVAYSDSVTASIGVLNEHGQNLKNYDLDTGKALGDDNYKGEIKCEKYGRLVECAHDFDMLDYSAGNDHADDLVSSGGGVRDVSRVPLEARLRLAAKRGSGWAVWMASLSEALRAYRAIPRDAPPQARLRAKKAIADLYRELADPDDWRGFSENNGQIFAEVAGLSDIAVLKKGHFQGFGSILSVYGEPVQEIPVSFSLFEMAHHPVLVIPSGGLFGLERSELFRSQLEGYVGGGGTLVVFAQQHGYEYSVLPVPREGDGSYRRVYGVGWAEDLSCFFGAAHINEWHQVLSGLRRNSPTLSVDGFITEYPSDSRVLLKRNKNGYPVLLMYEYGLGRVIVTTMYTDSAYGQGQASSEELALVRDIIAWAKRPEDLPEARPGGVVEFPIEVVNRSGREASSVKLLVYDPGRGHLVLEDVRPLSLGPRMSAHVPFSFVTSSGSPLGVYHVDYVLMDADGAVVQPQSETDSGRFVVADPPPPGYQGCGLTFSVTSDADGYLVGATATFAATVYNATGEARQLTALFEGQSQEVLVPAKGCASAAFTRVIRGWVDHRVSFYEGKEYRGWASKRCGGYYPSASVGIRAERGIYRLGEPVSLRASLRNRIPLDWEGRVRVFVRGPNWEEVFGQEVPFDFPLGGGEGELRVELPLSAVSLSGSYCMGLEVRWGDKVIAAGHGGFEVLRSQVTVTPILPEVFRLGPNEVGFRLVNTGRVDVGSGVLDVRLRDPRGETVWVGEVPFSLRVGQEALLGASVSLSSLVFGTYSLSYAQRDETGSRVPFHMHIVNRGQLSASLDRGSYHVREVAALRVDVQNLGSFAWDGALLEVSVEEMGLTHTQELSLQAGQLRTIELPIPIGETTSSGRHKVDVTLKISPEASLLASRSFLVPASRLVLGSSGGPVLAPGDVITLTLSNTGGVDTMYRTERLRVTDLQGTVVWDGGLSGSLRSMEEKTLVAIQIPQQAASGKATLEVVLRDEGRGDDVHLLESLEIVGLGAALETRTEQDVYFVEDPVLARTTLLNGPFPIQGGTLGVVASRIVPTGICGFEAMYPRSGYNKWPTQPMAVGVGLQGALHVVEPDRDRLWWRTAQGDSGWEELWDELVGPTGVAVSADGRLYVADPERGEVLQYDGPMGWVFGGGFEFREPMGVALGPDGVVYVVDAGLHGVFGFDREGDLLVQWGEEGSGDGQMSSPRGIAVAADGRVYVADTGNHRIQIFDAQGRFLGAWGGEGSGQGEFSSPQGVAVGPDNSVYVADTGSHRVQRLDPDGGFICEWGVEGSGSGQFRSPRGIAVGADGVVYVADTLNSRIQAFDEGGSFLFSWMIGYCEPTCGEGCEERELGRCQDEEELWPFEWGSAMVALSDGTFYAINPGDHVIQRLDFSFPWGPVVLEWGGKESGEGELEDARGLALGPDGSLYVADTGNHRIQRFDGDGNLLCVWGGEGEGDGEFRSPEGVAVGPDGSVYVADTFNHRIQMFDAEGAFLGKWGGQGDASGEFSFPEGVSVGPTGQVYVADTGNHRVQRFTRDGFLLGTWGGEGSGDGEFVSPAGVAVGPFGYVYVLDRGNRRVQRFDRDGRFAGAWTRYDCGYEMETCEGDFGDIAALCVGPEGTVYVADWDGIYVSINEDEAAQRIFEAHYPVELPSGGTQDFSCLIGRLSVPGAYLLEATLRNGLGQGLAKASHRFLVAIEDVVLRIQTDKGLYRVGETVKIVGAVENRAASAAGGLWLDLVAEDPGGGFQGLVSQSVELPAGGSLPILVTMTALRDGRVHLTGILSRGGRTLVEVGERFDVEAPRVTHSLEAPQVVGNEPFALLVRLGNSGRLPVSLGVEIKDDEGGILLAEALTLSGGEGRLLEVMHQVRRDTAFALSIRGDVSGGDTRTVSYGLGARIALSPSPIYGEGPIAVPITITNTGSLSETATVVFRLSPRGGEVLRTYALSPRETATDLLDFTLPEGDYVLFAASEGPSAEAQAAFQVRGKGRVGLSVSVGKALGGVVPVGAVLTNLGASELAVELSSQVRDEASYLVWSALEGVGGLSPGTSRELQFLVPAMALGPGHYTLEVQALNSEGRALASQAASFTLRGPSMELVQTPPHQELQPGQEGLFSFRVRNSGDIEGSFSLNFRAEELLDATHSAWLGPGEEKEVVFSGLLPDDLDERDIFGIWELASEGGVNKGMVRLHVRGVAIEVFASLDKPRYREGDVARFELHIQGSSRTNTPLLARVNYGAFEEERPFELATSQGMVFDVPISMNAGERIFYGIYHASGRSIHLNSLLVHKEEGVLNITTDKATYRAGEAVTVTVEGEASGIMTLTGPGGYVEAFGFSGWATRSVILPALMASGTYAVTAELQGAGYEWFYARRLLDVAGIDVKVKEALLDKATYDPVDTVELLLRLEGNQALGCLLRAWVLNPLGEYTSAGEAWVNVSDTEPVLVGLRADLSTSSLGIHRLIYGVYFGDTLLCSGSEAFDVGGAVLSGVRTDKAEYPLGTEAVEVEVTLLGAGQGTIELLLDGVSQGAAPVRLEGGVSTWLFAVNPTVPGRHRLEAILTIGGLTSRRETGFSYGTGLCDLTVDLWGDLQEGGESPSASLTLVARNMGRGSSGPSAVVLSQGGGDPAPRDMGCGGIGTWRGPHHLPQCLLEQCSWALGPDGQDRSSGQGQGVRRGQQ